MAVAMYGVGSIAALGTTMGLFWEVPVMLSLVYLGRHLGRQKNKNRWCISYSCCIYEKIGRRAGNLR